VQGRPPQLLARRPGAEGAGEAGGHRSALHRRGSSRRGGEQGKGKGGKEGKGPPSPRREGEPNTPGELELRRGPALPAGSAGEACAGRAAADAGSAELDRREER